MAITKLVLAAGVCLGLLIPLEAQRHLGPKDRDTILDAKLDPGFSSTTLNRVVFLPLTNEIDYPEGSVILVQNFLGAMHQKHPEINIVAPEEAKQLIQDQKLTNDYRAFLGNYINTGVPTLPFLETLGQAGHFDGVLIGRILSFGVNRELNSFGGITWSKNRAVVGMEITLLRTKDGRQLWWGTHGVQGEKNETVRDLAKVVGDVFAVYFGRTPY